MARKLPRLQRVLDAPALASLAYGEIASSIYFALGIIALHALGLTPEVLAVIGLLFIVVSLSYAEGTASIRETGGAATFVRIAFNDFAGFLTGWALFLDYLIVVALAALVLPHYLGVAVQWSAISTRPGDVVFASLTIGAVAIFQSIRALRVTVIGLLVPMLDLVTQLLLVGLGFAFLFSGHALTDGVSLGTSPSWHAIAFALPAAMLAFTGLETVANYAEEARRPGRDLPRSLFSAISLVVVVYVLIALVALSAFPATQGTTELSTDWVRAPLMGIVSALSLDMPAWAGTALRVYVGLTGVLVLLVSIATAMSGFGRLAYSLGEHGQLPRRFGRLSRRTLLAPESMLIAAAISIALLIVTLPFGTPIAFLASLYSFGVLLAFTAAQLAVIWLRRTRPDLRRPYRVPLAVRGVPIPSAVGAVATAAVFVAALATHVGARYGGPAWLAIGVVIFALVRRNRGEGMLEQVAAADEQVLPEATFASILVPMKIGEIGEEMAATAIKLAQERSAAVEALYVIRVPLDLPIDAQLLDEEDAAAAALAEAKLLGDENGVEVRVATVRTRSIGEAIVEEAERRGADLIVLGSHPRWRRRSRFFSPTVEYVLRKAPCEVLIVAFPENVLAADGAAEPEPEPERGMRAASSSTGADG